MFSHHKLEVYKLSLEFLRQLHPIIHAIPASHRDLVDQLRRASTSISLNIAEGAGKSMTNDKKKFYGIARGSALECAAVLDVLSVWKLLPAETLQECEKILHHIAAMLSKLILR